VTVADIPVGGFGSAVTVNDASVPAVPAPLTPWTLFGSAGSAALVPNEYAPAVFDQPLPSAGYA